MSSWGVAVVIQMEFMGVAEELPDILVEKQSINKQNSINNILYGPFAVRCTSYNAQHIYNEGFI